MLSTLCMLVLWLLQGVEEEVGVLTRQRATIEQQRVKQEVAAAQLTDKLQDERLSEEEVKELERSLEGLGPQGHKVRDWGHYVTIGVYDEGIM